MGDPIRGLEIDEFDMPTLYPWQRDLHEALSRRYSEAEPILVIPTREMGKTAAVMQMIAHLNSLGHAIKASSDALGDVTRSFIIFDELSAVRASERVPGIEPLPKKKRDWDHRQQRPPEASQQKVRAKGVVLMRDRTGKLVERKL